MWMLSFATLALTTEHYLQIWIVTSGSNTFISGPNFRNEDAPILNYILNWFDCQFFVNLTDYASMCDES